MFRIILLFLAVSLHAPFLFCYEKPAEISTITWNSLEPYFLPEEHPIKKKADALFKKKDVIASCNTLTQQGWEVNGPQSWSGIVIAKHSDLSGYLCKIYPNELPHPGSHCDHEHWVCRIDGARKIANEIARRGVCDRFKAPKKWIYPLPSDKHFVLVEEDMEILEPSANATAWRSATLSKELLKTLWEICEELGLRDSLKPDNIPFCKDGRIAFIDTEQHRMWPVRSERLKRCLSDELQEYWEDLTKNRKDALRKERPKKRNG